MPKITVAYRPTPESLAVAATTATRPVSWGVLALVAAMTAQNVYQEAHGLVDYHWLSYALAALVAALNWFLLSERAFAWRIRRKFRDRPQDMDVRWEFSDEGLRLSSQELDHAFPWTEVAKVRRIRGGFLLRRGLFTVYWVADDGFTAAADREAFAALAGAKAKAFADQR